MIHNIKQQEEEQQQQQQHDNIDINTLDYDLVLHGTARHNVMMMYEDNMIWRIRFTTEC